ncbi:MAG: hypothetical protein WBK77_08485 [Alphaproteobacteria bacterium]
MYDANLLQEIFEGNTQNGSVSQQPAIQPASRPVIKTGNSNRQDAENYGEHADLVLCGMG